MMDRLRRFMYGRYGGRDSLSKFLFVFYIILLFLDLIFMYTLPIVGRIIQPFLFMVFILYLFRAFSRNIYARTAENQKFIQMTKPLTSYIKYLRLRFQERDSVNKLYRCNKCHQIIRVPKGKGKIAITCPKCKYEFIKKT